MHSRSRRNLWEGPRPATLGRVVGPEPAVQERRLERVVGEARPLDAAELIDALPRHTGVHRGQAAQLVPDLFVAVVVPLVTQPRGQREQDVDVVACLAGWIDCLPDPLDPLALLWTNLVTDVSPAIALGLEPPEPDILERPPFRRADGMLDRDDWRRMMIDGGLMTATTMGSFLYGLGRYGAGPQARTVAFMTLTSSQLLYALTARSEGRISDPRLRSNKLLNRVTAVSLAMQAGTSLFPPLRAVLRTSPLSLGDWIIVSGAAALPALLRESRKPKATRRGGAARGART